jgi:hypothetical protein
MTTPATPPGGLDAMAGTLLLPESGGNETKTYITIFILRQEITSTRSNSLQNEAEIKSRPTMQQCRKSVGTGTKSTYLRKQYGVNA